MEAPPPALPVVASEEEEASRKRRQVEFRCIGSLLSMADIGQDFVWPYANISGPLYGHSVSSLPKSFPLIYFPEQVLTLTSLTKLDLSNNLLCELPAGISRLSSLTLLRVDGAPTGGKMIPRVPPEIGRLVNLKRLYLSNNSIITLPAEIGRLTNLQSLWVNNNMLVSLPPQLGDIISLKQLILNDNLLTTLPSSLASLKLNLKTFEVMGNRFVYPPPDVVLRGRDAILDHLFRFPVVAGNSLAADLSVYLTIPQFCDLELVTNDGGSVRTHKALLYARSGGKAEQLWKDANGRVNVNFSLSVLRNFLHFVYTDNCRSASSEEVRDICNLLRQFSVPFVVEMGQLIKADEKDALKNHLLTLSANPAYSDVTLCLATSKVPAHRFILCARSSYFQAMLGGKMKEASQSEVTLEESQEELSALLRYLYSGDTDELNEDTILGCAIAAHKYGVDGLLRELENIIQQGFDAENVVSIIYMCELHQMSRLLGCAAAYAVQVWDKVENSPDWSSVSADRFVNIRALGHKAMAAKEASTPKPAAAPATGPPAPPPAQPRNFDEPLRRAPRPEKESCSVQ